MSLTHYQGAFLEFKESEKWEFVQRVNAARIVVIMALTTNGNLLLVEQYRPPVEGRVIELPAGLVGDSGPDLSMMIPGSRFIGFNPAPNRGAEDFVKAGVPIVEGRDLRGIWEPMFGEQFPK